MQKLKKTIRLHSIKVMILWLLIAIMILLAMYVRSINLKSLTSYCEVNTEEDLNRCFKENPYVEIHTNHVYDGEYDYLYHDKKVARFVDIDLQGFSFISLMEPSLAQELFEKQEEDIVIKGKLEKFETGAKADGYRAIKELYVKRFSEEATREEVLGNFTLVQLNQYQGSKINMYFGTIVGSGFIVFFLFLAFKQLKFIRYPEKYAINDQITLENEKFVEKILSELENQNYIFHHKNIYITKNYLIVKNGGLQVMERKNVAWIYEHIVKQNGIPTNKSWMIYSLDHTKPIALSVNKKHKELGELLQKEFPFATFGYHNDLVKQWNQNPKVFRKTEE